jgi:hypothetical protein
MMSCLPKQMPRKGIYLAEFTTILGLPSGIAIQNFCFIDVPELTGK